jgi:hypothetical protein
MALRDRCDTRILSAIGAFCASGDFGAHRICSDLPKSDMGCRDSPNGKFGGGAASRHYSGLVLAARMTLAHLHAPTPTATQVVLTKRK